MFIWGFRVTGGFMRPDPASVTTAGTSVGTTFDYHHPVPKARQHRLREKARWYAPGAITVDTLGSGLPVLLVFTTSGQPYPLPAALVAAAAWPGVRAVHLRYTQRLLGESRGMLSTLHDWLTLAGVLAVVQVVSGVSPEPAYALAAIASAPVLTAVYRALMHRDLTARRRAAQAVRRVLVIGEAAPADQVVEQLATRTDHAYVVIGAVPVGKSPLSSGIPEAGRLEEVPDTPGQDGAAVLDAAHRCRADLVMVVPGARLTGDRLRRLSWAAQDAELPLVIASGLTDVAVRRVRAATAAGLNLLHIAAPVRRGPQQAMKTVLDRAGAALGLVLLAPLLALVAAAVRVDSAGPALYRQTRIGLRGAPFTMWKFRSMVQEADVLRASLTSANEQDGPLFKIRRDPRVTRVGRLLRRTSLDELPQLVNVLLGEMSLVGPRPPLPDEVAGYDAAGLRRLCVKPGITGPWQVGGRSELSWDESLALDLQYADNWSLTTDLDLLARTVRAVVDGRGAY